MKENMILTMDEVLLDPRQVEEKERDYKTSNLLAGAVSVNWKEKKWEDLKSYTPREQSTSLSCMAQASAKGYEVIQSIVNTIKKVYSAHPPYRARINFPQGGMWLQNLLDIMKKIGTTYEELDISQKIGETEMNRDISVETPYKISGYGFPDKQNDIDDIALAIEKFGHCLILIHGNKNEWTDEPVYTGKEVNFGHGICAVDYFLENGIKKIKIEDSTGHYNSFDKKGGRKLTEKYLSKRCTGAGYMMIEEPKYIFTTFMKKGFISNEVKELQKRLNKENLPNNLLKVDGDFGSKTDIAVKNYQYAHGLVVDGLVGLKTRAELNK
jgi:hypothetical protein